MSEERVLEIYSLLVANYALLGERLQQLEDLYHRPEARMVNRDEKFERLVRLKEEEFSEILLQSGRFCDKVNSSPFKERCYILYKEEFGNLKGFELPETAQEFLDKIFDYSIQQNEMALHRAELILHDTFPTLTGTNFEHQEEFEITMEMLKHNSDELDGIHARWKNRDGTIRFTIDGNVSNQVYSSNNVGDDVWVLLKESKGYMGNLHGELTSALEHGKVVMCRLHTEHTDIFEINDYL